MRKVTSVVRLGHPDYAVLSRIRDAVFARVGGPTELHERFPPLIRDAIDFVLDPIHTARTRLEDLDNVEKTFIGLKVEHLVRDLLDVPKGIRDLEIAGMDVDIKNTTGKTWMIPPETYESNSPVLVIASDEAMHCCWFGILVARPEYLTKPNRDRKRGVGRDAFQNILWLAEDLPYPRSRWAGLDMDRFRQLRKVQGGTGRACQFFRENIRIPIHRTVIQALLFDQDDYMKRLRGNGGARDVLRKESLALLSGTYHYEMIEQLGLPRTQRDEMIGVKPRNPDEKTLMRHAGIID